MKNVRLRSAIVAMAVLVVGALVAFPVQALASQNCGTSAGDRLCLNAPNGSLIGEVTISADVSGSAPVRKVVFTWTPPGSGTAGSLLTDFQSPYSFAWPTTKYLDGTGTLGAKVISGSTTGSPVTLQVTLSNGNTSRIQKNPNDWALRFQPRAPGTSDPVTAAVGDSASGESVPNALASSIDSQNPNLFLYLGDVYENGTYAEWRNNYGLASFDAGTGTPTAWGVMASKTAPTRGNHEASTQWRDYWHQRPTYTAFNFGGVHYLDLDSQCPGGCGSGSAQYTFVQNDLASNSLPCVMIFWHKPVLHTSGTDITMVAMWSLIANLGGDLVVNGHVHNMEQWKPLDANLQAGQPGSHMVELVSGSGGHELSSHSTADTRIDWQRKQLVGSLFVTSVGGSSGPASSLQWTFRDANNNILHTGTLTC